jgi:hypothetical protein
MEPQEPEAPWKFMARALLGPIMEPPGALWSPMEPYGALWSSMEPYGAL